MNHLQKNYLVCFKTGRNDSRFTIGKYHINTQAFINCMHSYERVRNVHTNMKMPAQYWFLCVKIIWISQCVSLFFFPELGWPIGKLICLDKNIFHWRVVTGLKYGFIMYYFQQEPWIVKIVNCFCPLVLSTCHNCELLIACPHKSLCFRKIRTTITFLISNTVVLNPYSHSTACDPQSFAPLTYVPCLFNRCSNTLRPRIDNGIQYCLDSSWTGIFKNKSVIHGQYIKNGSATM